MTLAGPRVPLVDLDPTTPNDRGHGRHQSDVPSNCRLGAAAPHSRASDPTYCNVQRSSNCRVEAV